ncbi:MAG: hypothetical protein EB127_25340, partial [Alphaproteobacteria bacterium]|nr:hypothetical protein [Alphaproteobacteria bacterium]
MKENKKEIFVFNKEDESLELKVVIASLIHKIAKKEVIENSKGKDVIANLLDTLIENNDPFVKALG